MSKTTLFLLLLVAPVIMAGSCNGRVLNPVTDLNWNNSFPVTVGGIATGAGPNTPPLHKMPPVCLCSPKPGVGVTYWEPRFVAEIARTAGCLMTIGGVDVLGSSAKYLSSENQSIADVAGSARLQVHWYDYPAMAAMDVAASYGGCISTPEFKMDTPTELDPLWNAELGAALNHPEGLLFANPLAALSCIPDAITSMVDFPLDLLYWCVGSQGIVYPLMGRAQTHSGSPAGGNLHILEKYIAQRTKVGKLLTTIGPTAQCTATYQPVWIKSQYRFDLVFPVNSNRSIVIGKPALAWDSLTTTPVASEQAFMVWRGRQCCMAPY